MTVRIVVGDVRAKLAEVEPESFHACVTSPPYFNLRDYQEPGQIGLEETPDQYIAELVAVGRLIRRALRHDGTFWLNLGDSYAGSWGAQSREHAGKHAPNVSAISANQVKAAHRRTKTGKVDPASGLKPKDLMGIPWAAAFALRADGWWLRSAIVWAKPNGMPGSQEDRCTSSYEMVFMLSKSADYWSDFDAIKTPPRESTLIRTAQDVQAQAGSHRANGRGESNGAMKAVGGLTGSPHGRHVLGDAVPERDRRADKQRGHGRQHAGFNERWDQMKRREQPAAPAMMRDVWFISPASFAEAHFAVMPDELAQRCILAGSPGGGSVLDPFGGAGTTGLVADRLGRDATLIELNPGYAEIADRRLRAGLCRVEGPAAPVNPGPLFGSAA